MAGKINFDQRKQMLELLDEGHCGKELTKILGVSKAVISKRIIALEEQNLISSFGGSPKFYKLTQAGKVNLMSLRVRTPVAQKTNTPNFRSKTKATSEKKVKNTNETSYILDSFMVVHDWKIKFKILKHGKIPKDLGVPKRKGKNWTAWIFSFSKPYKLKIELTTKSMIIYASKLEVPINKPLAASQHKFYICMLATLTEFAQKHGYQLDYQNSEVVSQHISVRVGKAIDEKIPKHLQHTIRLGRPAQSITGPMKQEAQVWIDKSRTNWAEIETNDNHYARLMQEVPIRVKNIDETTQKTAEDVQEIKSSMEAIGEFNKAVKQHTEQIVVHLGAVQGIKEGIAVMNQNQLILNTLLDKFNSVLERLEKKLR